MASAPDSGGSTPTLQPIHVGEPTSPTTHPPPRTAEPPGSPKPITLRTNAATGPEIIKLTTAHCTIIAADIVGFGQRSRNNINQVRVRHGMYRALEHAFHAAGIPWAACRREDRGDGVLILSPAGITKALFADHLPNSLVEALTNHNRIHPPEEQIRLRLALHAGEVNYDEHGVTGASINHSFRLLEADALRDLLAKSAAGLAIISSAWFFDEVVRHSEWSESRSYRALDITNKETTTRAWVRLLNTRGSARRRHTS